MSEQPQEEHELPIAQPEGESKFAIASRLVERGERFTFSGVEAAVYAKLKEAEAEYPGYGTPIDAQIVRFANEGIKVAFGKHPESGNVYILPMGSNDIENDAVFPRQLEIVDGMDEDLRQLILLDRV